MKLITSLVARIALLSFVCLFLGCATMESSGFIAEPRHGCSKLDLEIDESKNNTDEKVAVLSSVRLPDGRVR